MSAAEGYGESSSITVAEASRVIKDHAAKQPIRVELSEEQLEAILGQWSRAKPSDPVEITFHVGDRDVGNLRVASCAYWGDTCCV